MSPERNPTPAPRPAERPQPRKMPDREDQSTTPQRPFDVSRPQSRNLLHPG